MDIRGDIPEPDDKCAVGSMFDNIAGRYDFLNHLLSFGIDRIWRAKAVRLLCGKYKNPLVLDVATGTADLAIAAMKLDPLRAKGIDISKKMLDEGRAKIANKGISGKIELILADAENIPFNNDTFDIAMTAFGVRNFSDPQKGLSEMNRVLKNNGMIMVLEFSRPAQFPFKQLYFFYFTKLLPVIGRIFSKNRTAYKYLPDSVMQFPENEQFVEFLESVEFTDVSQKRMTGGIASVYTGIKKEAQ